MKLAKVYFGIVSLVIFTACTSNVKKAEQIPVFEESWESLSKNNKEPEWFADAKLGIYFHWGPYCVPAFGNEWYPRWMYMKDPEGWGKGMNDYHINTYGKDFDYHEFIPMFKAEKFDAVEWVDLFEKAGAKFAGPVAQHHDGFAMWDSKVNMWNSKDMGPERDVLGEIFTELEKRNMKTIATFHHARNLQRYAEDSTEWGGWHSHFPYHPDYATSTTNDSLKYLYGNIDSVEFQEYWLEQVREVVEGYNPDMIWFDAWLDEIPEDYRIKMVANMFNHAVNNGQEPLVMYKQHDLPRNVGVLDMEQAGMTEMSPDYWMTDITISNESWSYIQGQTYKPLDLLLRNMIDVWSKKGVVLLNISPTAEGVINEEQRKVLADLGVWMDKYGEAVYNTRTHDIFGYGIAEIEEGFQGEGQSATIAFSANDVRFTKSKDGKILFVFVLGMPEANADMKLEHILSEGNEVVRNVSVLGSSAELKWSQNGDVISLTTPEAEEMDTVATIFKVEFE